MLIIFDFLLFVFQTKIRFELKWSSSDKNRCYPERGPEFIVLKWRKTKKPIKYTFNSVYTYRFEQILFIYKINRNKVSSVDTSIHKRIVCCRYSTNNTFHIFAVAAVLARDLLVAPYHSKHTEHFCSKLLLARLDKSFDHQVDHYDSKLLLPKLFHRVELGSLLPKLQVTLKI